MEKQKCPEVRFIGFVGGWFKSNLAKCTDLLTGNPFDSNEFTSSGVFLVRGMNVKRGYLDTSANLSKYWSSSKGLERYLLQAEDIVIQMDGALIGKSYAKVNSRDLPALLVQRVARVRSNNVESEFIYQYIHKGFLSHISGIKTETAVPHLSLNDIRNFTFFLPDQSEQIIIGDLFRKLDQSIVLHENKLKHTQKLKKVSLEKMFPKQGSQRPEIRLKGFSGDWEERQLKDISVKVLEKNSEHLYSETFTNSAQFGVISQRDFFDKDISNTSNIGGYYVVKDNDFIYNPRISNFAPVGPVKRNKLGRTGVVSPLYFVFRTHDVDHKFLETYFETSVWHKFMFLNGDTGARSDRLAIKDTIFMEMPIYSPSFEEQQKIGQFFKQLDDAINLQKQQLQTVKNLKQALLEKMFV